MSENINQLLAKLAAVTVERDALAKALKEAQEQEPVAFVCDYNGYAIDGKHTEIDTALPVGTDLYARHVPTPAVPTPAPFIPDDDTRRNDEAFAAQSADHSEHVLEKVAPDCRTCANRGRVNGLSQESYCDSCIYQGRDWRKNHFVDASKMADAVKRRCDACAVLPCSCE